VRPNWKEQPERPSLTGKGTPQSALSPRTLGAAEHKRGSDQADGQQQWIGAHARSPARRSPILAQHSPSAGALFRRDTSGFAVSFCRAANLIKKSEK
jgi:hypothetical protein